MRYDPNKHHRRFFRLKGWDYTQPGAYFVKVCTFNRVCLFGEVKNGQMNLNDFGHIVRNEWFKSSQIREEIELDALQIMPNHFHGIILINENDKGLQRNDTAGANGRSPLQIKSKSLSSFMSGFKSTVTKQINNLRGTPGMKIWQRNYHDRIIRTEKELQAVREYIINNPMKWELDKDNPENWKRGPSFYD